MKLQIIAISAALCLALVQAVPIDENAASLSGNLPSFYPGEEHNDLEKRSLVHKRKRIKSEFESHETCVDKIVKTKSEQNLATATERASQYVAVVKGQGQKSVTLVEKKKLSS
jgi:hypothetical protein